MGFRDSLMGRFNAWWLKRYPSLTPDVRLSISEETVKEAALAAFTAGFDAGAHEQAGYDPKWDAD